MARSARQMKMLEIIKAKEIETQEDLAQELQASGFDVTQATISRDIKELGIVKVIIDGGRRQKYARDYGEYNNVSTKVTNLFKHAAISVNCANNLIVIKTLAGSANMAGMMVDNMNSPAVLGCVAGDDTVFVAVTSAEEAENITETLRGIIS